MGAGNSVTSRDLHVFANEPAEPIPAQNAIIPVHLEQAGCARPAGGSCRSARRGRCWVASVIDIFARELAAGAVHR